MLSGMVLLAQFSYHSSTILQSSWHHFGLHWAARLVRVCTTIPIIQYIAAMKGGFVFGFWGLPAFYSHRKRGWREKGREFEEKYRPSIFSHSPGKEAETEAPSGGVPGPRMQPVWRSSILLRPSCSSAPHRQGAQLHSRPPVEALRQGTGREAGGLGMLQKGWVAGVSTGLLSFMFGGRGHL